MISVNFPAEFFILLACALKKLKRFKAAFEQTASMGQQNNNDARGVFLLSWSFFSFCGQV
jgi:hypothetical protein